MKFVLSILFIIITFVSFSHVHADSHDEQRSQSKHSSIENYNSVDSHDDANTQPNSPQKDHSADCTHCHIGSCSFIFAQFAISFEKDFKKNRLFSSGSFKLFDYTSLLLRPPIP